jgi:hypothetical protein
MNQLTDIPSLARFVPASAVEDAASSVHLPPAPDSPSPDHLALLEAGAFLVQSGGNSPDYSPDNSEAVANFFAVAASDGGPHLQNHGDSALTTADLDESCGPHQDCCGGFFNHFDGSFTQCRKRLAQHARGLVCLAKHSFYKCSSCTKVLHKECWLQKANGNCVLVQKDQAFQCLECELQKATDHVIQRAVTSQLVYTH